MKQWNPEQYLKFSAERTQPAKDLANRIECRHPKRILDLGCGPGTSTAVLRSRFPDAEILGVDSSAEMVEQAKQDHPELAFQLFDATDSFTELGEKWDVIFSNACLQWVPNHQELIVKLLDALKEGGELAFQIPLHEKAPVHTLLIRTAASEKWKRFFKNVRTFYTLDELDYCNIFQEHAGKYAVWESDYFHILESPESVLQWYKGSGMRPYLKALPEDLQPVFEQEILSGIETLFPRLKDGSVVFKFSRLFLTAQKKDVQA